MSDPYSERLPLTADLLDSFSRLFADAISGDVHPQVTFQFDVVARHRAGNQQEFIDDEAADSRISVT